MPESITAIFTPKPAFDTPPKKSHAADVLTSCSAIESRATARQKHHAAHSPGRARITPPARRVRHDVHGVHQQLRSSGDMELSAQQFGAENTLLLAKNGFGGGDFRVPCRCGLWIVTRPPADPAGAGHSGWSVRARQTSRSKVTAPTATVASAEPYRPHDNRQSMGNHTRPDTARLLVLPAVKQSGRCSHGHHAPVGKHAEVQMQQTEQCRRDHESRP